MNEIMLSITTFWYFAIIVVIAFYMLRTPIKRFSGWFWMISNFVFLFPASYIFYDVYQDPIGFGILAGLCLIGQGAGACAYAGFWALIDVQTPTESEG